MKTSLKSILSLLVLIIIANTAVSAQTQNKINPVFEILKIQDGTESGDEVIYLVKITDGSGNPLVNNTNADFIIDIEFGVDSDVERADMVNMFPTSVAIKQGTGSTIVKLKVLNDNSIETSENLVAMIYNPTIGSISDTLSYAKATISDNDALNLTDTTAVVTNTVNESNVDNTRTNSVIALFQF